MGPTGALDLMAALVLEDGRRWGDAAVPEQWEDARAVLDGGAAPYHFLTRARGYAKTSDLAAVGVSAMLVQLAAGSRLYAPSAHEAAFVESAWALAGRDAVS
jgi:hypothetical protein